MDMEFAYREVGTHGQFGRGTLTFRPAATYSSTDREQGHTMDTGGNTALDPLHRSANWWGGGPSRLGTSHLPLCGCLVGQSRQQTALPRQRVTSPGSHAANTLGLPGTTIEPSHSWACSPTPTSTSPLHHSAGSGAPRNRQLPCQDHLRASLLRTCLPVVDGRRSLSRQRPEKGQGYLWTLPITLG
jgi:hypothetical protein